MKTYLEPTDPNAFVDFPEIPGPPEYIESAVICPQCKGHGGWNLELNAYPLHQYENTPENRHMFSHFRASCSQCVGHGYVTPENSGHIHRWKRVGSIGNCLHLDECEVCGKQWQVDSSG
jgi:hypothetical protein